MLVIVHVFISSYPKSRKFRRKSKNVKLPQIIISPSEYVLWVQGFRLTSPHRTPPNAPEAWLHKGCSLRDYRCSTYLLSPPHRVTMLVIVHVFISSYPKSRKFRRKSKNVKLPQIIISPSEYVLWVQGFRLTSPHRIKSLSHWGSNKMVDILQMIFSNAFSWMKTFEFLIKFH